MNLSSQVIKIKNYFFVCLLAGSCFTGNLFSKNMNKYKLLLSCCLKLNKKLIF